MAPRVRQVGLLETIYACMMCALSLIKLWDTTANTRVQPSPGFLLLKGVSNMNQGLVYLNCAASKKNNPKEDQNGEALRPGTSEKALSPLCASSYQASLALLSAFVPLLHLDSSPSRMAGPFGFDSTRLPCQPERYAGHLQHCVVLR